MKEGTVWALYAGSNRRGREPDLPHKAPPDEQAVPTRKPYSRRNPISTSVAGRAHIHTDVDISA